MVMIEGDLPTGTETSRGFVHHLELHGIRMPILIKRPAFDDMDKLPDPRIYEHSSAWALPGGGSFIHNGKVKITKSRLSKDAPAFY